MEKQRTDFFSKFCRRLLILLLSGIFCLWAEESPLKGLIPLEGQNLYTNTDIEFKIFLPGQNAAEMQIEENQTDEAGSSGAKLKAVKKSYDLEMKGTWIQVWFTFEKEGLYSLPPLVLQTKYGKKTIEYESVRITENPSDKYPRIVIAFANGKKIYSDSSINSPVMTADAGRPLKFTVYAQYTSEIKGFDWSLPKNAIFSKTGDYDYSSINQKNAGALIPIADFEWESLEEGIQIMPRIKMTLASSDVIFPEFSVRFKKGSLTGTDSKESPLFSQAFSQNEAPGRNPHEISEEDCLKLARLYREESKSIISRKKKTAARKALEAELGITPWLNRRLYLGDFGISTGISVFSIPEEGLNEVSYISGGNAVIVKERTGDWLFIKFGETEGWCKKDEVIVWTWATF
ncbi:MAG: hypothetical protein IJ688_08070 [Treponema sp.]|nr:hypothetical protein [Treponema sp.]